MRTVARRVMCAGIVLASIALDQLVKFWAKVDLMARPGGTIPIIENVFHLTYVENRGAAFGILQNQRWLFLVLTVAVVFGMGYVLLFRKKEPAVFPSVLLSLMMGGAIGNFIDRAMFGYVTDMFDARIIGFAVFNVADMCLVCSVIVLCIWMLCMEIREQRVKKDGVEHEAAEDHQQ